MSLALRNAVMKVSHCCRSAAEFGRFLSDIKKALPVIIVCGAGFSFLLGFVWLVFVKWFGGFLVWLTVWATLAITIIVTIISYFKAGILTKALIQSEVGVWVQCVSD